MAEKDGPLRLAQNLLKVNRNPRRLRPFVIMEQRQQEQAVRALLRRPMQKRIVSYPPEQALFLGVNFCRGVD
jgi:hypothetical protein